MLDMGVNTDSQQVGKVLMSTPLFSLTHSQDSQDMAPALQDQGHVDVKAAGSPRAASPASAEASFISKILP